MIYLSKHHILTLISLIILLLVIVVPGILKVNKRHNDRLLYAVTTKIKEKGEVCYYNKDCSNLTITLKELYELKYLEEIANPITKEYYNENSYIIIHDHETEFIEVK